MPKRILIMAGGTGGHVFPALAVALELAGRGWQVSWLGTRAGLEAKIVPAHHIAIDWLAVAGVRGKGWPARLGAALRLPPALGQALAVLRRRRPDVVLGMGGFVAGPGGLMARALGIPLVIHEQNRLPGTTNRLLAAMARRVLTAFPDSFNGRGAECTGNPLRQSLLAAANAGADAEGRADGRLRLLVVGGSQGARALNQTLPEAVALLDRKAAVAVRHQAGPAMADEVGARYQELAIDARVSAFIDDMAAAYQWADLVVCRAGAMTVSELAAMGKPSILVPFPHAIDDHQTANARYLADAGAGVLLPQALLDPASLARAIGQARPGLAAMAAAARSCARLQATARVADICAEEAGA